MSSNKRAFIEYKENGQATDPYLVLLASQDGTFGIKTNAGAVIVPSGTSPEHSGTGVYEYTFEAESQIVYRASWEVYPTVDSQPIYVQQIIGPFSEQSGGVKAVADQRGTFIQGTIGNILLIITDIAGTAIQPDTCTVSIQKDGTYVIEDVAADYIKDGAYAYDWIIASDQEIGKYQVIWKYVINGSTKYEYQEVIVSEKVTDASDALYGNIISDFRNMFNLMVGCAQSIPVYHEEGIPHDDTQTYNFTFKRWNQSSGVRIYRNNKLVSESEDIEINYFKGSIKFLKMQHNVDTIHTDYNFRWFNDEQIDQFLANSLSMINLYPPASNYGIMNVPGRFLALMLYGAAKDALRELMMCLMFQQPQEVFGGPNAARQALNSMETLKKNYEEEFFKGLEQKKFGPYPKSRAVVTPEYTLPGGRSRWFRYMFGSGTG